MARKVLTGSYQNAITAEAASSNLNSYVQCLYKMEPRIRVYPLFGDVEDDKGYFVTKEHIYIPYLLPKAEHDIAHLLELTNQKRWTMTDWGMPRFEDKVKCGPFFAALAREVRTRAIQMHISEFSSELDKLTSTAYDQFNNPFWKDMAQDLIPFGRFRCFKDIECWKDDLKERTYKAWSWDRIVHEWEIRLNHIRDWMETS